MQAAELDTVGKGTQEEDRLKARQLLLFNDMLMLVKLKPGDKLSYKAHIDFDDQVSLGCLLAWTAALIAVPPVACVSRVLGAETCLTVQVNFSEVRDTDSLTIDGMGHHSDKIHGER